jgi:hypothetical protein
MLGANGGGDDPADHAHADDRQYKLRASPTHDIFSLNLMLVVRRS